MRLFIDCEWNGYRGSLMSLALVPQDRGRPEFYVEVALPGRERMDSWVREHVAPYLTGNAVTYREAQDLLAAYLGRFTDGITVVADWPEDIEHFCRMVIVGPGQRMPYTRPLRFEVDAFEGAKSRLPHNALHDARANRDAWLRARA